MQDFIQKINPKGGLFQFEGTGSPEGVVTAYVGNKYKDTATSNIYYKGDGDNTNTGWINLTTQGGGGGVATASATFVKAAGDFTTFATDSGYSGERILWDTTISQYIPNNEIILNTTTGIISVTAGNYLISSKTTPAYASSLYSFGIRVIVGGSEYVAGLHAAQSQASTGTTQRISETAILTKYFSGSGKIAIEHTGSWNTQGYAVNNFRTQVSIIKLS